MTDARTMQAMLLDRITPVDGDTTGPLTAVALPVPEPADDEVLIEVATCGVCHTELDEIEGRTPPPRLPVVPGHEVVGRVVARGSACRTLELGTRVGVGWIHRSDGSAAENLSAAFVATGRDVDGGYAEYMTAPERYAFPLPENLDDVTAAPLLCAGAVGYRALRLTRLRDGDVLGLTGFGGSGHLVLQFARRLFPASPILVFARDADARAFARELGADWSGATDEPPPRACQAIIDTTPAWAPVLAALEALCPGGRLVINAIRKEAGDSERLADLDYARHLWLEKELTTVANVTGADIVATLALASALPLRIETETFALAAANEALRRLKSGGVRGAKVLRIGQAAA
jgi:propanol-preferring alcohol dehydrogenase